MAQGKSAKSKPKPKPKFTDKAQSKRFVEAAGSIDSEKFDAAFMKIVPAKAVRDHHTTTRPLLPCEDDKGSRNL
jgi:hypothetical protein